MSDSPTHFYPEIDANPDFPAIEEKILDFWARECIFEQSVTARPSQINGQSNAFIFYDGPPFANGLPHYGHLLTGFVKDLFARYETMKGKRVERRFGWDCHGLPAEMGAEKELGISGRQAIINYGIDKFNAQCRTSVMAYAQEWRWYVTRQARWVDFDGDYKTMDVTFMESVLWAFKQLYDKGLVYEAYRVMPYSWGAETPLSNFETRLDNSYREREDKAVTVAFELKEKPPGVPNASRCYALAWTTTPWTLPSNLALAVNKNVRYGWKVVDGNCYIASAGSATLKELAKPQNKDAIAETPRLSIRLMTLDDAQAQLDALFANPLLLPDWPDELRTLDYSKRSIAEIAAHQKKHGYSIYGVFDRQTGELLGRAGCMLRQSDPAYPPYVDLSYSFRKEAQGKGIATEAVSAVVAWMFDYYGAGKIETFVIDGTPGSVRVLQKTGFKESRHFTYKNRPATHFAVTHEQYSASTTISGEDLIGLTYTPIFPYFTNHANSFRILDGTSFVTDSDGTGIVHMAPGFGEEDQRVCEANGIELVCPVDHAGRYTDAIYDLLELQLKGLNVIAEPGGSKFGLANDRIIDYLKKSGHLIKQETIKHNYPHCWRTDTPLIYRALPSWYVEVSKFKDRMVELNQQINWIPGHIKDGMFGRWLENARDWSISRNRFWGTPIPIWKSATGKIKVFGSIAELEAASGQTITDLHRPFIDELVITENGEEYTRVADVFDCWFESGSMPYGQAHYPFEHKDWFEHHFPADFIVEYQAQTRGWFYTLMVLGTALFDKPPFLNCICHGVVLDDKGQKLSKRLNNYADPKELFEKFGADALRWFMMASPVMRGNELYIDKEGKFIRDVVRLAIKPVWNAYNFFCLYANADGIRAQHATDSRDIMDRYILAKCREAVEVIKDALDSYDTPGATIAISQFFEALNNWYIRRNKERFWKTEKDADKQAAYDTLYTVLVTMAQAAAPLLPLTLEEIYKGLTGELSVHLADFPHTATFPQDTALIAQMDLTRDICNAALGIRNKSNIRVRQPLQLLTIIGDSEPLGAAGLGAQFEAVIRDEVNVKQLAYAPMQVDIARFKLKLDFKKLGQRLPDKVKAILPAAKKPDLTSWMLEHRYHFPYEAAPTGETLEPGTEITEAGWLYSEEYNELHVAPLGWRVESDQPPTPIGDLILLEEAEYEIKLDIQEALSASAQALASNDALVMLNLEITPQLHAEGIARDLVRMIQQARKDAGLNVSDRIKLYIDAPESIMQAITAYIEFVIEQTLTNELLVSRPEHTVFSTENMLDGQCITLSLAL